MWFIVFLALSDTSFSRGVDEDDFSLDEAEEEGDTTATLLANARKSGNLASTTAKRTEPEQPSSVTRGTKRKKTGHVNKDLRPPHLRDDHVFNNQGKQS